MPTSQSTATVTTPKFLRLTSEQERKKFYPKLTGPKWWTSGGKKTADRGWVEIFDQSDWRCIYCERDLAASTDALAESTEEHLVPRSLLEANHIEPNVAHNMAACCAGCNTLKAEFVPPSEDPCWKNRKSYVKACYRFISSRRLENFRRYRDHVEGALKRRAGL